MFDRAVLPMAHAMRDEGVIKYRYSWEKRALPISLGPDVARLIAARDKLVRAGLIGVTDDGIGYGNLSVRLWSSPQFLVSGTATGRLREVDARSFSRVATANIDKNYLHCEGEIEASSESLTHAALYSLHPAIRAVAHGHSAALWNRLRGSAPTTGAGVAYGTPEMAYEMIRLFKRQIRSPQGIVVMAGHEDGVISFGPDLTSAVDTLLSECTKATGAGSHVGIG